MEYILASASPRRQELLKMVLDTFTVCPADVDETMKEAQAPLEFAKALAEKKALSVAKKNPHSLVIGCDTIVTLDRDIFGKPKNKQDAERMLSRLSGRAHDVMTAVCLAAEGKRTTFAQTTTVQFYPLEERDIQWYTGTMEWKDKAGGYGIQGAGALLVKGIQGDYYNVVGLPVALLYRKVNKFLQND